MRVTTIGKLLGCVAAFAMTAMTADAAFLTGDQFSYTGQLQLNGWNLHSGAATAKPILSDGSAATLNESTGSGQDLNLSFPTQGATDKVYASMLVNVESGGGDPVPAVDANGLYFTHFKDMGFSFRARVLIGDPVAGGNFTFGISADTGNLPDGTAFATDFSYDTWYKLVFSYDASTGVSELWVDPVDETSAKITDAPTTTTGDMGIGTLIEGLALRQSDDYTGFIKIDNVGVGMTFMESMVPEPGTATLLILAGFVVSALRRRANR